MFLGSLALALLLNSPLESRELSLSNLSLVRGFGVTLSSRP